ncbi:MAG: hypothetical protein COA71_14725 [SAR86 cluster bacterium]|uniref:Uncharacterized protein n=1 Tax=SAR86 cluster bacterium TaxID=2030880 RepID=A0A2A5C6A5_9GAMM|nr:MAG: hypothetical protein COA71_14725 [SAR86 cluster bacterium]
MSDNYVTDLNDRVNDKLVELKRLRKCSREDKSINDYECQIFHLSDEIDKLIDIQKRYSVFTGYQITLDGSGPDRNIFDPWCSKNN